MKKLLKSLFILFFGIIILNSSSVGVSADINDENDNKYNVIMGENRVETAIGISRKSFVKSKVVILADGRSFADSISSVVLASNYKAPILLTRSSKIGNLEYENIKELRRLKTNKVYIVGGVKSVPEDVENELKQMSISVERISGENRCETSWKASEQIYGNNMSKVVFVNGSNFYDAISIAAYSYKERTPIIFTSDKQIEFTKEKVKSNNVKKALVIGDEKRVNPENYSAILDIEKIEGKDRYEISKKIDEKYYSFSNDNLIVTSGETFADALAGVTFSGKYSCNMMIVKDNVKEIKNIDKYKNIYILGGRVDKHNSDESSSDKNDIDENNENNSNDKQNNGDSIYDRVEDADIIVYVNPHQDDETLFMALDIIRDVKSGKDVHLLQMTDGCASYAIRPINRKLEKRGIKPLNKRQFVDARDSDLIAALETMGVSRRNIVFANYVNLELTKQNVIDELEKFENYYNKNNEKKIMYKTVLPNDFDTSDGQDDHRACYEGVLEYTNDKKEDAKFLYSCMKNDVIESMDYNDDYTQEEEEIWKNALNSYNEWNPSEGRYQTGFISVGSLFEDLLNNPHYWAENAEYHKFN